MTFEEAKKRIKECRKLSTDDYNKSEDEFIRGEAFAYKNALAILDEIDTEPSGSSGQLTLKELAIELRKIFKFKYLTASYKRIHLWSGSAPIYREDWKYWIANFVKTSVVGELLGVELVNALDLSEYKDADGNIDYSRCIVEVE